MWSTCLASVIYTYIYKNAESTLFTYVMTALHGSSLVIVTYASYMHETRKLKRIEEKVCIGLFGSIPDGKILNWRNEARFKLSIIGFGSLFLLGGIVVMTMDSYLQFTSLLLFLGGYFLYIIDILRDSVAVMCREERERRKKD